MSRLTEVLRKLGNKLTGKSTVQSNNVLTVLDDIANDYEAPTVTEVVANPTLAGTESNLTGLQVGDTKYVVPQSGGELSLYQHNILVEEFIQAQVLTTSSTPFTLATFIEWLENNQYPCNGMAHDMSEDEIYGNALYLFVNNDLLTTHLYDKPNSGNAWNYNFNDNVDLVFNDTVIQIQ